MDSFDRFTAQDANAIVAGALRSKVSKSTRDAQARFLARLNTVSPVDFTDALEAPAQNPVLPSFRAVPQLDDTTPPREPHVPLPVDPDVKPHRLMAWRNDGGAQNWTYNTREVAQEHADALSGVIYWKWAIVYGRDTVAKGTLDAPELTQWWDHD